MSDDRKPRRREQILQALAIMLEEDSGKRITTAALARQVGVSEAALYRHFPSKARMFEGLIDFIEESIFARITRILDDIPDATTRCGTILSLLLGFAEKNPGLARVLGGVLLRDKIALRSDSGVAHFLAQFLHGVLLELANTLGADAVHIGQVVQRCFIIGEPTALQDIPRTIIQSLQRQLQATSRVFFKIAVFELRRRVGGRIVEEVSRRLVGALFIVAWRGIITCIKR